jgi:hypothetical protein
MTKYSIFLTIVLITGVGAFTGFHEPRRRLQTNKNWWEFDLGDPVLDETALYYLGQSYYGNADVADVLETIHRVNVSDPWSWTEEWRKTAKRMDDLAQESLDAGEQSYITASP